MKYYKLCALLLENSETRLKELVNQLFKDKKQFGDQPFGKYINDYQGQPSPVATKYVSNSKLLKNYNIKCCKGTYDGYDYYFPIVELDDQKYVIDLADNTDGTIIPKVESIDGSEYKIVKIMSISEFNDKYSQIIKEFK